MSRLDSFIRRLEAQRACLEYAAGQIRDLPGPVLELGLGNGRTYDHLRELLPEREIFVFERAVNAHPDCIPDPAHLILGDVRATLPRARVRLAGEALREIAAIRPELDGLQVMEHLGIAPGPLVGEALAYLLDIRLDEGPIGHDETIKRLDAWWDERSAAADR